MHGCAKTAGFSHSKKKQGWATVAVAIYHLAVITAIAIYATGRSQNVKPLTHSQGQTMAETGIILLLALSLIMDGAFILLIVQGKARTMRPLLFALAVSLVLLMIRLIYQSVAVFVSNGPRFNPVTGSIALRMVFQFLPVALILLAIVAGGVMSAQKQRELYDAVITNTDISPDSRDGRNASS